MSAQPIDKKILKSLEPLTNLGMDILDELAQKSRIEKYPADRILFRQGDRNNRLMYVLSGQVELSTQGQNKTQLVKSKTDQARYPLSSETPRHCSARSKSEVTILSIDQDLLEIISGDTQSVEIEVTDLSGEIDVNNWMLRFLQSPAFVNLPTENIQSLLMKLEEVAFNKGDVVVRQGDESEYYFIVQQGRCSVSRKPAPNAEDIRLAILSNGDGFGEEALITGSQRNASIIMLEDGSMMRLNKSDFLELLIKPLINYYNEQEVMQNLAKGSLVLDVRPMEAFNTQHIEGSINIPLSMLRAKLSELNKQRDYILCCEDGSQSAAAAFLLIQQGMTCHVLKDGLKASHLKNAAPSAAKSTEVETSTTRQADENKNIANAKAARLKQQNEKARQEAIALAKKTEAAEKAKAQAVLELKRLKEGNAVKQDAQLQSAKQKIEAETLRAQKAELELRRLVAEKNKNTEQQSALQDSLAKAEKAAQESARIAAEAHKQAEREAVKIRQQAEQEAERLRKEMEAEKRRHEEAIERARKLEEQQQQAAIEDARQKAREVVKNTAAEAKAEAALIRQQAVEEAEALRHKVEATRSELEKNISEAQQKGELQRQMLLEEARREAEKMARQATEQAELEAEQIRLKALAEAEKLRAEMEEARQLVEQEAARVRQKQQLEEAVKRQAEEEKLRAQREAEQQQNARLQKQRALQQQQALLAEKKKQDEARKRAEAIKARLEAVAKQKQQEQERDEMVSGGLAIGSFKLREKGDRLILESNEDVFIFRPPKVTRLDKQQLMEEAQAAADIPEDELPSFEVNDRKQAAPLEDEPPAFIGTMAIDAIIEQPKPQAVHKEPLNVKKFVSIAAALVIAVGVGTTAFLNKDKLMEVTKTVSASLPQENKKAASLLDRKSTPAPASSNNTDSLSKTLKQAEKEENEKAESEFRQLLKKWKASASN